MQEKKTDCSFHQTNHLASDIIGLSRIHWFGACSVYLWHDNPNHEGRSTRNSRPRPKLPRASSKPLPFHRVPTIEIPSLRLERASWWSVSQPFSIRSAQVPKREEKESSFEVWLRGAIRTVAWPLKLSRYTKRQLLAPWKGCCR